MKEEKLSWKIVLLIFLMPVLKDTSVGGLDVNIALSDIVVPFALFYALRVERNLPPYYQSTINVYVKYCFFFVLTLVFSTCIGAFRWMDAETSLILLCFFKIVKIIIGMAYGYVIGVVYLIQSEHGREKILKCFAFTGCLFALTCILGVIVPRFKSIGWAEGYRATGTTDDPNLAATLLFIYLGICLHFLVDKKKLEAKYILFGGTIIVALFLTASKSMLVSFAVASFVFILMKCNDYRFMLRIVVAIFLVVVGLYWGYQKVPQLQSVFNRLFTIFNISEQSDTSSLLTGRNEIWESGFNSLKHGINVLTGVGYGFYGEASKYYGAISQRATAHNTLISMFVELGLIGLITIISIYFNLIKKSFIMIRHNYHSEMLFIAIAVIMQSMSLNLQNNRNVWAFFMLLLVQYTVFKTERKKAS